MQTIYVNTIDFKTWVCYVVYWYTLVITVRLHHMKKFKASEPVVYFLWLTHVLIYICLYLRICSCIHILTLTGMFSFAFLAWRVNALWIIIKTRPMHITLKVIM